MATQQLFRKAAASWALATFLLLAIQVDAQFFTKSSKSIPRMGRRSEAQGFAMDPESRRVFIDSLLDEYGPNLANLMNAQSKSAEIVSRNEQPMELDMQASGQMSRNERSQRSEPRQDVRDLSLGMRAMKANWLMQRLTSGQPLPNFMPHNEPRRALYDK